MIAYLSFKKPVLILGAFGYDHVLPLEKITFHDTFIQLRIEGEYFSSPLSNVRKIEVSDYDEDLEEIFRDTVEE